MLQKLHKSIKYTKDVTIKAISLKCRLSVIDDNIVSMNKNVRILKSHASMQ